MPHLPRIMELQEQAAIASRAFTAALGANDPRREMETSLALADSEEAVAAYLAPLKLDAPWHPAHSATIAVNQIMMAIYHLDSAARIDVEDQLQADIQADRASRIVRKWCDQAKALEIECNLAVRAANRGRFADALSRLARVRDEAEAAGQKEVTLEAISTRAEVLCWLGDAERAIIELKGARPVEVPAPTPELDKAALLQATSTLSWTDQHPWIYKRGKASTQIGGIAGLEQLERHSRSIRKASKRLGQYAASLRWHRSMFVCLRQLADRDPKLIPDMKDAFAAARRWHDAYDKIMGLRIPFEIFEPELLLASGDAHRALAKTIELADTVGQSPWLRNKSGVFLTYRARALRALGQISEARVVARAATAALQKAGEVEAEWRAWLLFAETTDNHDERREAFEAGMAAVEKMRLAPLGWRLDNLYLSPRLPLYQGVILVAAMDNDAATALSAIEAVKSRGLAAIIGAGSGIAPNADPELVRKHTAIDAEISRLQAAILAGRNSPEDVASLQACRIARAELAERLQQADPRWQAMTSPDPVRLSPIIDAVHRLDAVAVDLFLHQATLIAVLVADGSAFVSRLELSPSTLAALERLSRSLSPSLRPDRPVGKPDQTEKDPAELGLALDTILPPLIAARVTTARRILIAAHGVLHLLPWPVVPVTQGGRRLIEIAEVGMLANLACVPALAGRPVGTACCAAIGAPKQAPARTIARYHGPPERQRPKWQPCIPRLGGLLRRPRLARLLPSRRLSASAACHNPLAASCTSPRMACRPAPNRAMPPWCWLTAIWRPRP